MTRVLIYCRQSVSDGEDTLSLDSQAATLRRWATEQGWTVIGEVRDFNEKGWDDARPGLAEAMARASRREFDVLAVWSLDRLARSVRITETTLYELERNGIEIRSHKEPWTSQPMLRQIYAAVAEQQTRDISAHVRRAVAERARHGIAPGRVPFGYERDAETRRLVPHETRAPILQEMFHRFVAGAGTSVLADWLTSEGVPTFTQRPWWHSSTVLRILRNPVYTGVIVSGSVRVEDAHPPLIDSALWQRVQERLDAHVWTRRKGDVSSGLKAISSTPVVPECT